MLTDEEKFVQAVLRSAKLTGRTLHIKGKLDATLAEQYFEIPEDQRRKIRTLAVQDVETVYNNGLLPIAADLLRLTTHQLRVYGADQPHLNHLFDLYGWRGVIEQRPRRLIPRNPTALVRYRDTDDVNLYVTRSMNEVTRRFVCGKDIVKGFEWSYNEILGNVLDHAESPLGGFAQINYFRPSKRLNMIVVDTGNGLKTTLSESHHNIEDDRAAIALAIQKGVTRNTEIGQGNGLWGTTQIVKAVRGNLRVWSGSGELWVTADGEEHYSKVPFFHGTLVEWQIPTRNAFSLQSAIQATYDPVSKFFEDYEPMLGEIRFILHDEAQSFGNRPIGKQLRYKVLTLISQCSAHRCVLDFGNIRLISSSFADEFVGKLAEQLGDRFSSFVTIDRINNDNAAILDKAIRERLAVSKATRATSSFN